MEITTIETKTFESMLYRLSAFAQRVETLCKNNEDKSLHKWRYNKEQWEIIQI